MIREPVEVNSQQLPSAQQITSKTSRVVIYIVCITLAILMTILSISLLVSDSEWSPITLALAVLSVATIYLVNKNLVK